MRARDNPFATDRVLRVRYRLPSWPALLERLAALQYRAAIIGQEGAGKTTLLEDLAPHLEQRGFIPMRVFLNRNHPRLSAGALDGIAAEPGERTILLLDGAEQLSRLAWLRLKWRTRQAAGLVITRHRAGGLPTLIECRTSPELLAAILAEMLGSNAPAMSGEAGELFTKYRGNIRDVLRALYDRAGQLADPLHEDRAEPPAPMFFGKQPHSTEYASKPLLRM